MDGVLVDAKEWHYLALNKALSHYDIEIGREEHLSVFDGLPTAKKLEILSVEKGLSRADHRRINTLKQQYTYEIIDEFCQPSDQHQTALSKLKAQGYGLAVCSNSRRESVKQMMEKSQLMAHLDFYLSYEDVDRPKPDPAIYLEALTRLDVRPKECLVLEDNAYGIQAARDSGAHVLEVENILDVSYSRIMNRIESLQAA